MYLSLTTSLFILAPSYGTKIPDDHPNVETTRESPVPHLIVHSAVESVLIVVRPPSYADMPLKYAVTLNPLVPSEDES